MADKYCSFDELRAAEAPDAFTITVPTGIRSLSLSARTAARSSSVRPRSPRRWPRRVQRLFVRRKKDSNDTDLHITSIARQDRARHGRGDRHRSWREVFVVAMIHAAKGRPKIVPECTLPLTARRRVTLIVTELAVIKPTDAGLVLRESGRDEHRRDPASPQRTSSSREMLPKWLDPWNGTRASLPSPL